MSTDPATASEHSPAPDSVEVVQNETSLSASADLIYRNGAPAPDAFRGRLPALPLGLLGPTDSTTGIMTDSLVPHTPLARRGSPPADGPAAGGTDNQEPIQATPEGGAPPPPVQEGGNGDASAAPEASAGPAQATDPAPGTTPATDPAPEGGNGDASAAPEASAGPAQATDPAPGTTPATDPAPETNSGGNGTPARPAGFAVVNFNGLMRAGKETANTKFMYRLVRRGARNPLMTGPKFINVYSLALSDDITSEANIPRFIVVVMSHYMDQDVNFLKEFRRSWKDIVDLAKDLKEDEGQLTEDEESIFGPFMRGITLILDEFNEITFQKINAIQLIKTGARGSTYNPIAPAKRWMNHFLDEAEKHARNCTRDTENDAALRQMVPS